MLSFRRQRKKLPIIGILTLVVGLIGIFAIVINIGTIQNWLSKAKGQEANIIIDVQGVIGPLQKPWQSLAQGGESPEYRFAPVSNQIKQLKPQYIRIDHIYDFYDIVSKSPQGQLSFDWTKLDLIINDITSTGAIPFISLSYMPPALGNGDVTGKPTSWPDWALVVQKTIEHISGSSGLNIANVYYEVWNEPDLFGDWKTYGDKNYLTLYHQAALGAQKAQNTHPYFIGGPATTSLYQNWLTKFFDYATKHSLRVDFYSWHVYSSSPATFTDTIKQYDHLMRQYPNYIFNVEPIITEWGHDSQNHPGYDTNFAAAHTVAVSSQIIPKLPKAFIFEIQDGLDPNGQAKWGRWGLMTHQDHGSLIKPRYHAVKFLSELGDQKLSLVGEGTWIKGIAAKKDQSTQLVVTNYDPKGTHQELVPITFQRTRPGNYTLTTQFVGRPKEEITIATTSAAIKHHLNLPPNSVALLELTPKYP